MFKALLGGNRPSSNASSTSSKPSHRSRDSKSSSSRKSRSDDRDRERGLGDLDAYSSPSGRKYGTGESERGFVIDPDREVIERVPKDRDRGSKSARRRDHDRSSRDLGQRSRGVEDWDGEFDPEAERRDRRRNRSGDTSVLSRDDDVPISRPGGATDLAAPGFSQPPVQYDAMATGSMPAQPGRPSAFDSHVHQQFPGQFPTSFAAPYRPPNPAGEAAEYYGDQGQSVAEQPGIRPSRPAIIPNSQPHLMAASPVANPPPEPSSMGQVGAAADYYAGSAAPEQTQLSHPAGAPLHQPTSNQHSHTLATTAVAGAAAYGIGSALHGHQDVGAPGPSITANAQPSVSSPGRPPHSHGMDTAVAGAAAYGVASAIHDHHDSGSYSGPAGLFNAANAQQPVSSPGKPSHSHGVGAAVGAAAAGAAAGYMLSHHHSSSAEHPPQYTVQDHEHPFYGGAPMHGSNTDTAMFGAGAAAAAGLGAAAAHGMHSHGPAAQGPWFQSGDLAFQQRRRGALDKFVDFWRDPEGVGKFEDYTEAIGVCKYCFEPGTTSRDAPRKHHYHRRRSWDRYSGGSRVEKPGRFTPSEDESRRRRKSKGKSWLPGLLGAYAAKSLFANRDFGDTYSVKSGRVASSRESVNDSGRASRVDRTSQTSRGVYRRRSRSRSRSSSRSDRHSALRNAALGAAVGSAAYAVSKSRHSHSSKKSKDSSGWSSSSSDSSQPNRVSVAGGLTSFFTAPSKNRKKAGSGKSKGIFSFNNSSSSSTDADLAFGASISKKRTGKSKKKGRSEKDVDAKLLGLGAAATALASASSRPNLRAGEILAGKGSRVGYTSTAMHDDDWEDLPSEQSSASVASDLAFGRSSSDSQTYDSSALGWVWGWGRRKDKKKRRSSSPKSDHTGAKIAAGALGRAALASAYYSHSKQSTQDNASSTGSLQHVVPVPTSDPSKFDVIRDPPSTQPPLVRPGPIPLQQPQPVAPVSNALYTSQGVPAYYPPPSEQFGIGDASSYPQSRYRPHRRSDSSPVFGPEPLEGVPAPGIKRRSTTRDQATVQFELTDEQAKRERGASRRESRKRDKDFEVESELVTKEREPGLKDAEDRPRRRREQEDRDNDSSSQRERRRKDGDTSSWIGPAAIGAIGAAAAATALSEKRSHDDSSEASERRHSEGRERRRAERRRTEPRPEMTVISEDVQENLPTQAAVGMRTSSSRDSSYAKPVHDDYAQFFVPEELRHSREEHARDQGSASMRDVVELATEKFPKQSPQPVEESQPEDGNTSWSIPSLNFIGPTPPQSLSGSVADVTSPTTVSAGAPREDTKRQSSSSSRISWAEHETYEHEVQSGSSDHDSDQDDGREMGSLHDVTESEHEQHSAGFGKGIEFAAVVAAATAATGFDPTLVTDDPTYHTRPAFGIEEQSHGFIEGEVESDGEKRGKPRIEHIVEGEPVYSEPETLARKEPVIVERAPSGSEERPAGDRDVFTMPGGFGSEDSPKVPQQDQDSYDVQDGDSRFAFSAPAAAEAEALSRSSQFRRDSGDLDEAGDDPQEPADTEGKDGKKKRRKRRSKRDSSDADVFSVTSPPAKIEAVEDRPSKDDEDKPKGSVAFLRNIFGSRVSEPTEPRRSPSVEGRPSRDVKSEIEAGHEESRQREKSYGRFYRDFDREGDKPEGEDDASLETYKSHRQQREEKRRHRYEELEEYEKARDDNDDSQSFLAEGPELPHTIHDADEHGASGLAMAAAAGAAGFGMGLMEERLESRTTSPPSKEASSPTSPELLLEQQLQNKKSRRSSLMRMSESPTAIPLHFRRPPISPSVTRPVSVSSPVQRPADTPTQPRHRRPTSTEFKSSREIRPLFLVERLGAAKMEAQPNESLPSLPSSKPSSRTPSLEDLRASDDRDVQHWEMSDLNQQVQGSRVPRDLGISIGKGNFASPEHDILGSQQTTPTAQTFDKLSQHQQTKKEKPTYEFHSPSELLQDPSVYAEIPPSPTLDPLPSVEGSAVGVPDEHVEGDLLEKDLANLPALHDSRPFSPLAEVATPTQDQFGEVPSSPGIVKGVGFAGIVGAAVSAAMSGKDKTADQEPYSTEGYVEPTDETVFPETPRASSPSQQIGPELIPADATQLEPVEHEPQGFGAVVEKRDIEQLPQPENAQLRSENENTDNIPNEIETAEVQIEEQPAIEPPTRSSSKRKKKNKKKAQSVDLTETEPVGPSIVAENDQKHEELVSSTLNAGRDAEPETALQGAAVPAPDGIEESNEPVVQAESVSTVGEAARELEAEVTQLPVVEEAVTTTGVSSRKAKREKKKNRRSKALEPEEQPGESVQSLAEVTTEQDATEPVEELEKTSTKYSAPVEVAAEQLGTGFTTSRDEATEASAQFPEQSPFEEAKEPEVEFAFSKQRESSEFAEGMGDTSAPSPNAEPRGALEEFADTEAMEPVPPTEPKENILGVDWKHIAEDAAGTETITETWPPPSEQDTTDEFHDAVEEPMPTETTPEPEPEPQQEADQAPPHAAKCLSVEDVPEVVPQDMESPAADDREPEPELQPEITQETVKEIPDLAESVPPENVPEAVPQDRVGPTTDDQEPEPEPEVTISRKASKKNKKKNKRKSIVETPVESEPAEVKEPLASEEGVGVQVEPAVSTEGPAESDLVGVTEPTEAIEGQPEPAASAEGPIESEQHVQTENTFFDIEQDERAAEAAEENQDSTSADAPPDTTEQPQEASPRESWEEPPMKGRKAAEAAAAAFAAAGVAGAVKAAVRAAEFSEAKPKSEFELKLEQPGAAEDLRQGTLEPLTVDGGPVTPDGASNEEAAVENVAQPAGIETEQQPGPENEAPIPEQPAIFDGPSIDPEANGITAEREAPRDIPDEDPASQPPTEAEIPLTSAQKKKAKRDKKKKRQSALVDETPVPELRESAQNESQPEVAVGMTGEPATVHDFDVADTAMKEDSATAPPEIVDELAIEDTVKGAEETGLFKDIEAAAEETAREEPTDSVTPTAVPVLSSEEQLMEDALTQEGPESGATEFVEATGPTPLTPKPERADKEVRDDSALMEGTDAIEESWDPTSEPLHQTDEPLATTGPEEQWPDTETVSAAAQEPQEGNSITETGETQQDQPQDQIENAQASSFKKSKKDKKKKKNRQSRDLDDEQAAAKKEEEVAELPDAAAGNEGDNQEESTEDLAQEATVAEPPVQELMEEMQTATSKKKARKDKKKKRKSVSFSLGETADQPNERGESAGDIDIASPASVSKSEYDVPIPGEYPSTGAVELVSESEEKGEQPPADVPMEDTSVAADEQGENEAAESALERGRTAVPFPQTVADTDTRIVDTATGDEVQASSEEKTDFVDATPEALEEVEQFELAPEVFLQADVYKQETDAGAERTTPEDPSSTELQSSKAEDIEQSAGSSESKADKKKKKKRGKSLDLSEDAPPAFPEPEPETQGEADNATDHAMPDVRDAEEAAPEQEKLEEEAKVFMSAKEKRKAKKEKKRQSKNLDLDEDGQNAASSAPDVPTEDSISAEKGPIENFPQDMTMTTEEPSEPSLATAVPPREDDKERQSYNAQSSDDKAQDRIWTDEMISSQVEQQQKTPPQTTPEHPEAHQSIAPGGSGTESYERDINAEEDLRPPLADVGEASDDNRPTLTNEGIEPQPIETIEEIAKGQESMEGWASDNIALASTEKMTSQLTTEEVRGKVEREAAPAEEVLGVDTPEPDAAAIPEEEGWLARTSSKKKKKRKEKEKERQLEGSQMGMPPADSMEQSSGDSPSAEDMVIPSDQGAIEKGSEVIGETGLFEAMKGSMMPFEEITGESSQKIDEPATEAPKDPVFLSEEHISESVQEKEQPTAEDAPEATPPEIAESSNNVAYVAENVETQGPTRKMSKKEKKKKRRSLVQESASQAQEGQPAAGTETSISMAPDNVTVPTPPEGQEDELPVASSDATQHPFPEENTPGPVDVGQAELVEETAPVEEQRKSPEVSDSYMGESNVYELTAEVGQSPMDITETPQPVPETDEVPRDTPVEDEDIWPITYRKKSKKDKTKVLAQEPTIVSTAQAEESRDIGESAGNAEIQGLTTDIQQSDDLPRLSTEETQQDAGDDEWGTATKRKGKKAKKDRQKQKSKAEEVDVLALAETRKEPANIDSTSANEHFTSTEDVAMASEGHSQENERSQQWEPTVSLDPFELPLQTKEVDVDKPMESTDGGAMWRLPEEALGSKGETVSKGDEETQTRLQSQAWEKEADLEVAEDLFEDRPKEPQHAAPVSRKLSKKEKRKAKQKIMQTGIDEQEGLKEAEAPSYASEDVAPAPEDSKEREVLQEAREDPAEMDTYREIDVPAQTNEDATPAAEEPMVEAPPSRTSSRKQKKKARKASQREELEQLEQGETKVLVTEQHVQARADDEQALGTQPLQQGEDAWPSIEWGKDKPEPPVEHPEERLLEPEQVINESDKEAVGDFDESAIRWAVAKEPEPSAEDIWSTSSKKKKRKSKQGNVELPAQPIPVEDDSGPLEGSQPLERATVPEPTPEPTRGTEGAIPAERPKEEPHATPVKQNKVYSIFPNLERASFRRQSSKTSLRSREDNAEEGALAQGANRDHTIKVPEAPIATADHSDGSVDSYPRKPWPATTAPDPFTGLSTTREIGALEHGGRRLSHHSRAAEDPIISRKSSGGLHRTTSIHGKHHFPQRPWSLEESGIRGRSPTPPKSLFGGPVGEDADANSSPSRTSLGTIAEQELEGRVEKEGERTMAPSSGAPKLEVRPEHLLPRPQTPVRKFTDNSLDRKRWPTPDEDRSMQSEVGIAGEDELVGVKKRRQDRRPTISDVNKELPPTPTLRPSPRGRDGSGEKRGSLRRTTRTGSADLRGVSWAEVSTTTPTGDPQPPHLLSSPPPPLPSDLNLEQLPSSSAYDPLTDKGKRPVRGMTDVYEAWGETPPSPLSPNRPPSVRHRRSMQHFQDLEARIDQLVSENRLLIAAREEAENKLQNASIARRKSDQALNTRAVDLRDKEAEVEQLRKSVDWFKKEVSRLTHENEGLIAAASELTAAHAKELLGARESSTRELDEVRFQYNQLSGSVEDRVRQEVDAALANKDTEIRRLYEELETTRDKVRELQQQIAASMQDDILVFHDEDYFDGACQKLCGHVQQWVLRFSKHSDHHRCRRIGDLHDEKIADRFDNAILDGSDADAYLADRVRRRDVFMSVVMTMIWEYIFTRYLFGMDRDQRQKLKSLEKQLGEIGPRSAVHRWRATTLTLLAKRSAFATQRESDTEAVALEIFGTLSRLLPPPTHVESQLLDSLRKVLRVAVNLSIEMRTQLAEYIMLPPLQPEYDTNGDLVRHVYFNASLMNERSGETTSNEELEAQQAVVRIVLFPLVVKKGNDTGEGEDEIVVCPAQVLVARPGKDNGILHNANQSVHSIAPLSAVDVSNMI